MRSPLRPRRSFLLTAACLSLACLSPAGALAENPDAAAPGTPGAVPLRVVAYNIKHGRGMDGKVDLERTAAVLERLGPDLVALQEVDQRCDRSGKVAQADRLGELLGMHHRFAKFMDFQGGEYGLAVLSRFPIVATHRHALTDGAEPRYALEVVVSIPGGPPRLSFVSLHHDWTSEDIRVDQVRDLTKALADRQHPVVLAGDFNAQPGAKSLALVTEAGFDFVAKGGAHTFPADKPRIEIDFIATRNLDLAAPATSGVHAEPIASDHRPVTASFQLRAPAATQRP